ncbi:DUF481 domain-containing protein [Sessilibacter sp. MAH2]
MRKHLLTAAILTFANASFAGEWGGVGEAGLILVDGNSQSKTLNSALEITNKGKRWEHSGNLDATSAESENEKSAESYTAAWDSKYLLNERTFLFGDLRYFNDKFDSFEEINSVGAGAGYKIFLSEELQWDVSAGLGYRQTELEESGEDQSGATFLVTSSYNQQLTETTSLSNVTRVESGDDNTFVQNKLGLNVAINSSLALKLGYEVRYNSEPAAGDESQDTITSVNLVYKFK